MVRGLGQVVYREHLREMGLFAVLKRRLRQSLIAASSKLSGNCKDR